MNSMELKQALTLIKGYIADPKYSNYDKFDEFEESINKLSAFLEQKLESNTTFTSEDLTFTLQCFGNIRGHLNSIEGKKTFIPGISNVPVNPAPENRQEVKPAVGEKAEEGVYNEGDSFNFSEDGEFDNEDNNEADKKAEDDGPDYDLDEELPEDKKAEEKKEAPEEVKNQEVDAKESVKAPVHFVKDLLSDIEFTIASIDVTKNLTLDNCISNIARNDIVLDREPDYQGSASSKRNMITLKYENGEPVKGYFTVESGVYDLDSDKKYDSMLRAALTDKRYRKDPLVQKLINNVLSSPNGVSDLLLAMVVEDGNYDKTNPDLSKGYDEASLAKFIEVKKDEVKSQISTHPALAGLLTNIRNKVTAEEIKNFGRVYLQYQDNIKAQSGSVIAGRNVAMSNVANVLGVPNIVARSVPATANWNGETVKGVFTENIDGVILPTDFNDDLKYTDIMTVRGVTPEYKMQLADLQILDYICGNVDRHQSNFAFLVKDGKLVGVKGFDNDFSFGTAVSADSECIDNGVPLDDITVITEHMAKNLLNLDDETLKASLTGTGLGDQEIKACIERKNRIQDRVRINNNAIKYSACRILTVKDSLWKSVSIKDIAATKLDSHFMVKNIFGHADSMQDEIDRLHNKFHTDKPYEKETIGDTKEFIAGKRIEEITPEAFKEKIDTLKDFANKLKEATGFWSVNHTQYTELFKALNKSSEFENKQITDYKVRLAFDEYLKDLDEKVDKYLIYKMGKKKENDIGKKRLEIAEKVKSYVNKEKTIFHEASRDYMEKKLEEDSKEYFIEKNKYDKVIAVLAEETVRAHVIGKDKEIEALKLRDEEKEALKLRAMELIKGSRLVGQIIGKKIDEFVALAENENDHQKLYDKFSLLLYDYAGKTETGVGAKYDETKAALEQELEFLNKKAAKAAQKAEENGPRLGK